MFGLTVIPRGLRRSKDYKELVGSSKRIRNDWWLADEIEDEMHELLFRSDHMENYINSFLSPFIKTTKSSDGTEKLTIEAPGLSEKDIKVSYDSETGILSVNGNNDKRNINYSCLTNKHINPDHISVSVFNGLIEIEIKKEQSEEKKNTVFQIPVNRLKEQKKEDETDKNKKETNVSSS